MKHFVYRTHNLINQKEYTGKHSTDNLEDGYYGSGLSIKRAVAKYGIENFAVEILSFHDTSELAFIEEEKIVDEEYIERVDTYNQRLGGEGGWDHINNNLEFKCSIHKGKFSAKDKEGNTYYVVKDDPRIKSGELVSTTFGKVIVKDKDGNMICVLVDDFRIKSGEFTYMFNNKVPVKDKSGNTMSVSVDDPRYLSGELISIHKGFVPVKDKSGNTMSVSVDDPRYLSGELLHINKGRKHKIVTCPWCNKTGGQTGMSHYHFDNCLKNPNADITKVANLRKRKLDTIILKCPYCGKEGKDGYGKNMTRHHFDNCKFKIS